MKVLDRMMKVFLVWVLVYSLPCVAVAEVASLQIKVLEGEGVAHPAAAHISRPITVEVTDDKGQPVAGAAVTFQLPPDGPSGLFSNGLRSDLVITDAFGRASIQSIQLNKTGGQFRIRITAVRELTRDLGKGLRAVQQARASTVSLQRITEPQPTLVEPAEIATLPVPLGPGGPSAERSADILPTTTRTGPRTSTKWFVLAALAVAGGAAFFGVSRATRSNNLPSKPVVTIGTPTFTIGNP